MTTARPQNLSLIETISAGYAVLNRRLWVLLIPVALDLYLWLGAQVSFAPFFRLFREQIAEAAALAGYEPQLQERLVVQIQQTDMRSVLALFNFVPVLVPQLFSTGRLPSEQIISVGSPPGMMAAIILINVGALLVSSFFLTGLAAGVSGERLSLRRYGWRWLVALPGIGSYVLLLLGASVTLGVPFAIALVAALAFAPTLTPLAVVGWLMLWFWIYVYTGFAVEAVLINRVGPLQAIAQSVTIVRRSLLATLGLLALSVVIMAGLNIVWRSLVTNLPGLLLAITGSAYVGSGLVAARLVFYRDRLARALQLPAERGRERRT